MAPDQIVLFTLLPQGATVAGEQLPVSVFVASRLHSGERLGQFPDWLQWTRRLQAQGLTLTLQCSGQSLDVPINTEGLNPELWEQLFHENTLVRSHAYDDYTGHGIISYSAREAMSALKGIYQRASVDLALPGASGEKDPREESLNRRILADLTDGLNVHWDGKNAPRWRAINRLRNRPDPLAGTAAFASSPGALDSEGLYVQPRSAAQLRQTAQDFAVYSHMPTPDRDETPLELDAENVLDFHQALASLNAYPTLLRALGLVFDIQLPLGFVAETPFDKFNTLSVQGTTFDWQRPTQTPELSSAYIHIVLGDSRLFVPAPRMLQAPQSPTSVFGLLNLDPAKFGVAQVDFDGGMHKAIMLADALNEPDANGYLDSPPRIEPAPHPEVFDPGATLPSLRSGGFQLYADRRGQALFDILAQSKAFDTALMSNSPQPRPFFAEDLLRGYRLDVWEAQSGQWRSLHWRRGEMVIGDLKFDAGDEEGFLQAAATQPAPGAKPADKDLYLHEAWARWAGWSLSVPRPSKTLSHFADPAKAIPDEADPQFAMDQPLTPFQMQVTYKPIPGTLPSLRFGRRYRFRARAVDLAGNSLKVEDPFGSQLAQAWGIPQNLEGFAYLRYEPVAAPLTVLRDAASVKEPGSALDRLVIRTFNAGIDNDAQSADTHAADRHLVPPRTGVESGERMGMFDDAAGKLKSDAATWELIASRDEGMLPTVTLDAAGKAQEHPLVADENIPVLPYLPDWYARGVALRDLPGSDSAALARLAPDGVGSAQPVAYTPLSDPNPRPGSATLIPFGDASDWQTLRGIRFALAEPAVGQSDLRPTWDADQRLLTVFLAKGRTMVVPVTSYLNLEDMKQMGVWQWLREYVERIAITQPHPEAPGFGAEVDRIAHVLQRAVEGGHWMLTPPLLLTLVHAVQQPLGRPEFTALPVNFNKPGFGLKLKTEPIAGRRDPTELAAITAWREVGSNDAYLLGALKVHGASTEKVDIQAAWDDFVDDPADAANAPGVSQAHHDAAVDEVPLRTQQEGYLTVPGKPARTVGYYDPEHDQIVWTRSGEFTGEPEKPGIGFRDAAPRHQINDARHHRITYTAVATSRYREYFDPALKLDFTRSSAPVVVDVPASVRPLAPAIAYVLPTFGWQRQTDTNMQRSVRFGGGLRVYLHRPWYSSGNGELLGVALWNHELYGPLNNDLRVQFKPYVTQWGMDPIWDTGANLGWPAISDFQETAASDRSLLLEERNAIGPDGKQGRVSVVGHPTFYDPERALWYADLTLNFPTDTYMPFVRLALTRYQPNALEDVKISRVVLADFAQLTPTRAALITSDPHHARTLRVAVSGVAPRGPQALARERGHRILSPRPTQIRVRLQERIPSIPTDLGWQDAPANAATIRADFDDMTPANPNVELWAGTVTFDTVPQPGRYRLLIEETEYVSANYVQIQDNTAVAPGRLIYAETIALDTTLLQE